MQLLVYLEENKSILSVIHNMKYSMWELNRYIRRQYYICIGLSIIKALTKLKPVFFSTSDS